MVYLFVIVTTNKSLIYKPDQEMSLFSRPQDNNNNNSHDNNQNSQKTTIKTLGAKFVPS